MTNTVETRIAGKLDATVVEQFGAQIRGELLQPGDAGYDAARRVWNGMVDHRPLLIARCRGTADVIAAVNFGRENALAVSVRGGGHNVAGQAVVDGGLMIDLSLMRAVLVDPQQKIARVQGGALFADLDHECQAFGLAVTGGHISHTGVGGLTLGGGIGWLARKFGLTSDNLISVDLVTADGSVVTASDTQNADLLWGLRGGGGNFGVATSFTFQLHEIGTMVVGGMALWPESRGREIVQFFREFVDRIPNELTVVLAFITAPPLPFIPDFLQGQKVVAIMACYVGDRDEGLRAVQPIKDLDPTVDLLGPIPYRAQQTLLDAAFPHGQRYYSRTDFMDELNDEALDLLLAHAATMTSPHTGITFQHYQGAVNDLAPGASAYTHRDAKFVLLTVSEWGSAEEDAVHIGWTREFGEAMQPFSRGVYVNFLGADEDDRVRSAYSPEALRRLATLKGKHDPDNLFHLNHNVKPEVGAAR